MGSSQQRIGLAASGLALMVLAGLAALGFFASPAGQHDTPPAAPIDSGNAALTRPHRVDGDSAAADRPGPSTGRTTLPADIDRQMLDTARWIARGKHPLLNPDLVRIFEQLTGRAGEPHLTLGTHVPPAQLAEAQQLLEKYRRYRQDLAVSATPESGRPAAEVLDTVVTVRLALQRRHFSETEIAGLFADDNQYDRFTIERLRTSERADLTIEQKEEIVAKLEHSLLTSEQREARDTARLPTRIAAQNIWFDKSQTTPQQRMDTRSAEFGTEAAARMAEVDRQEAEWQQRIARLAAANPATQQQMRITLFTPQEQLRIDGSLALHHSRQGSAAKHSTLLP